MAQLKDKSIIVISNLIDSTVKSYQPDVNFYLFKTIDGLAEQVNTIPIRAQALFFTRDVVGQTNVSFTYLYSLLTENSYLHVDRVVYITEENSFELQSVNYLIEEKHIENWEIITGSLTKAFVTEIINGTAQLDNFNVKHMAVYRQPRAEYVRARVKEYSSLDEEYPSDEQDLADIPDVEIPRTDIPEVEEIIEKIYMIGDDNDERTAFTFLAAQYLSQVGRTIVVESDVEYHKLTEFYTKSGIEATEVSITDIYNDTAKAFEKIRKTKNNLVVITCIDREYFNYNFIVNFLYYNLMSDFRYILIEHNFNEMPKGQNVTVIIPDTVIGCLKAGESLDKSDVDYVKFIGVDLGQLQEVHLPSSTVISKILQDVLTNTTIHCPIVSMSSMRLNGTIYDLGSVIGRKIVRG